MKQSASWALAMAVVLLALARPAGAAHGFEVTEVVSVAWTADSAFAVVTTAEAYESSDESRNEDLDGPPCTGTVVTVFDAAGGATQRFLSAADAKEGCSARLPQLQTTGDRKALEGWTRAHPSKASRPSLGSGDKQSAIETTKVLSGDADGKLSAGVEPEHPRTIELAAKRGGKRYLLSSELKSCSMGGGAEFLTYWSPDGKALVWTRRSWCGGEDGLRLTSVASARLDGPRIDLAFDKKMASKRRLTLLDALDAAKLAPLHWGEAKDPHPQTVVYAAKGFEEVARRAAASIPQAKLDVLSWKSDFDVVIAVAP